MIKKQRFEREITVTAEADVVVAGGGLGGVAAAVAAARAGASVILVESNGFLGGVATAGMCCSVFNCMFSADRELLVKGIPLELVDTLAREAGPGMSWREHKGHMIYDVECGKLVLANLLEREGVTVRLNSPVTDVIKQGNHVTHLVTSGKNGLEAISCHVMVDATGDCDAAVLAGAQYKNAQLHRASYVFRLGNVDVDRFVDYLCENPAEYPGRMDIDWSLEEAVAQYKANGTFLFPHGGGMQMTQIKKAEANGDLPKELGRYAVLNAMQMHLIRDKGVCHVITGEIRNDNLDASELSSSTHEGKRLAFLINDIMRKYMPGFERSFVSQTADDLGIRGSRCIVGEKTFTKEMKGSAYRCEDAIGVGVIQSFQKLEKAKNAWKAQVFGQDVWEIPLGCLIPKDTDNIIIGAGRGADSQPPLLLRVMVDTMSVGQGAGVVAAMAAKSGVRVREVDYPAVRSELERQGVIFPEK